MPVFALARALARARECGCPFEDALYAETSIEERDVVRLLAERFGFAVAVPGHVRAARGRPFEVAVRTGVLRLEDGRVAIEARSDGLDLILSEALDEPERARMALVTRADLALLATAADAERAASKAAGDLRANHPSFCAATLRHGSLIAPAACAVSLVGGFVAASDVLAIPALTARLACLFFLGVACLRLAALLTPPPLEPRPVRRRESTLPTITVLVPLAGEDAALSGLVASLCDLDYPRARLDIKLLVEEDDVGTAGALARLRLPGHFEVLRVPPGAPRTKPRALNYGLSLARGCLTVVYDAEDRPARRQLRDMVEGFLAAGPSTAAVQARLVVDPAQKGLLAALFRTEYAGLFAVLLPALAAHGCPIPLGGTSNAFRTEVLREIGGWDPFNVTEDAEIGLRLFRLGHGVATIASATEEEAPHTLPAWFRQRRRWLKGWMVTLLVHVRNPVALLRDCGITGTLVFVLLIGGIVLSALLEPLALVFLACRILDGSLLAEPTSLAGALEASSFATAFVVGHVVAAATGLVGLSRLGQPLRALHLLALPLYWLALSFAAWAALCELCVDPFRWDKTAHLLARVPAGGARNDAGRIGAAAGQIKSRATRRR